LQSQLVERYDVNANKWTEITIQNLPKLTSFGFDYGNKTEELYIVGGSDGEVL